MRCILLLLCVTTAAGCDRGTHAAPAVAIQRECTPMPVECPAALACELSIVDEDGHPARVCGGTACCQAFCEANGCTACCVTEARGAP